ncbi:ankyrin repeat domain-containing protein [Aquimarina algiphila]|uniref:ankyrin repeat domain-containing protein n=1 Tax=Aquimarina algiphila TaxID=2047982 RepID=UPI002493BE43|nr:ankyrin repeat domain-containing protein [Aquimarina algiphila]
MSITNLISRQIKYHFIIVIFLVPVLLTAQNSKLQKQLYEAISKSEYLEVKKLIKQGANPNIPDRNRETALSLLVKKPIDEALPNIDFILKNGGTDINNKALHKAVQLGKIPLIDFLLENGSEINPKKDSHHPLLSATKDLQVFKHLVSKGANIHKCPIYSLFHIIQGDISLLKYALSIGLNTNGTEDDYGRPIVHIVSFEKLEILLQYGAKVDIPLKSQYNRTLLHRAAFEDNPKRVRLLLKYGANKNAKDSFGYIPFQYAGEETKKLLQL